MRGGHGPHRGRQARQRLRSRKARCALAAGSLGIAELLLLLLNGGKGQLQKFRCGPPRPRKQEGGHPGWAGQRQHCHQLGRLLLHAAEVVPGVAQCRWTQAGAEQGANPARKLEASFFFRGKQVLPPAIARCSFRLLLLVLLLPRDACECSSSIGRDVLQQQARNGGA